MVDEAVLESAAGRPVLEPKGGVMPLWGAWLLIGIAFLAMFAFLMYVYWEDL